MKLSISYKNNKLFIMVMHIRGLVSAGAVLARSAHLTVIGVACQIAVNGRRGKLPWRLCQAQDLVLGICAELGQ